MFKWGGGAGLLERVLPEFGFPAVKILPSWKQTGAYAGCLRGQIPVWFDFVYWSNYAENPREGGAKALKG